MEASFITSSSSLCSQHHYSRDPGQRKAIDRLHKLIHKVYQPGEEGRAFRVEFVCVALANGIEDEIISYQLWDEGWEGLGERQWDCCFEMDDAERVIADVVIRARKGGFLSAVRDYCGTQAVFDRWLGYSDKQAVLF